MADHKFDIDEYSSRLKTVDLLKNVGEITVSRLITADDLTMEEISSVTAIFHPWIIGEDVLVGYLRRYEDHLYKCIQAHTTQSDWPPIITPALWVIKSAPGIIQEWVQPGSENPYMIGDQVTFEGHIWESIIDNNVWSPTAYPAGWEDKGVQ